MIYIRRITIYLSGQQDGKIFFFLMQQSDILQCLFELKKQGAAFQSPWRRQVIFLSLHLKMQVP